MKRFKAIYATTILILFMIMAAIGIAGYFDPQLSTKLHRFFILLIILIPMMIVWGVILGVNEPDDDDDKYWKNLWKENKVKCLQYCTGICVCFALVIAIFVFVILAIF